MSELSPTTGEPLETSLVRLRPCSDTDAAQRIERELSRDFADLEMVAEAGASGGLFGGSPATYGGTFGGVGGAAAEYVGGFDTFANESYHWLGSFSSIDLEWAATSAEIHFGRLTFALGDMDDDGGSADTAAAPSSTAELLAGLVTTSDDPVANDPVGGVAFARSE